jgi:hypothetical protein
MAVPPIIGQLLYTDYPPVTDVPASFAASSKPEIIYDVTTSLSFSVILVDTPRIIKMVSILVNPMA